MHFHMKNDTFAGVQVVAAILDGVIEIWHKFVLFSKILQNFLLSEKSLKSWRFDLG